MNDLGKCDVAVFGSSYSGLAAAIALAELGASVAVIGHGERRSARARPSSGLPPYYGDNRDYLAELKARAKQASNLRSLDGEGTFIDMVDDCFGLATKETQLQAHKVILATGVVDILPAWRGLDGCWGVSAFNCPYCHLDRLRNRRVLFYAYRSADLAALPLISDIAADVSVLASKTIPSDHLSAISGYHNVKYYAEDAIDTLINQDGELSAALLNSGREVRLDSVLLFNPTRPRGELWAELGCTSVEQGHRTRLLVDNFGRTNIEGVWGVGDVATSNHKIYAAIQSGTDCALNIHRESYGLIAPIQKTKHTNLGIGVRER